jgi:flavoprotein
MKILWVVTGASHMLEDTLNSISEFNAQVDLVLTIAGEKVVKSMELFEKITDMSESLFLESGVGASPLLLTKLSGYQTVVVAPCTANTVAKIRYGIADSLASNLVAQALKKKIHVIVLPTDDQPEIKSIWKNKEITFYSRQVDLDNLADLKKQEGLKVVNTVEEIKGLL